MNPFKNYKKKQSDQCKSCTNNAEWCWTSDSSPCVKFMPKFRTNFTELHGIIETQPEITADMFYQHFMNWIESMGWHFCGSMKPYKEE